MSTKPQRYQDINEDEWKHLPSSVQSFIRQLDCDFKLESHGLAIFTLFENRIDDGRTVVHLKLHLYPLPGRVPIKEAEHYYGPKHQACSLYVVSWNLLNCEDITKYAEYLRYNLGKGIFNELLKMIWPEKKKDPDEGVPGPS